MKQSAEWYATDEATRIADNVILYQHNNGGWEKNIDMASVLTEREKTLIAKEKTNADTTIDNGATYTQLAYLAKVYRAKTLERHRVYADWNIGCHGLAPWSLTLAAIKEPQNCLRCHGLAPWSFTLNAFCN